MVEVIKNTYCCFLMQQVLKCEDTSKFYSLLDSIIDGKKNFKIEGDEDLKSMFHYMYNYRLYKRTLTDNKPQISNKVIFKTFTKIFF